MDSPHDTLFKRAFGDPAEAAPLLKALLPAEANARIVWPTLKVADGSYVDEGLRELRSDILYEARTNDGQVGLVYVLLEHQSSVDGMMAFRVHQYVARIWARGHRLHPRSKRLPAVLPIVLYLGERRWTAPTAVEDLVEGSFAPWTPRLSFILDDLTQVSDEVLSARALEVFGEISLRVLRDLPRSPDPVGVLTGLSAMTRQLAGAGPKGLDRFVSVLEYLSRVANVELPDVQRVVREVGPVDEEHVMTTLAQRMEQEGREKGREEGREEGRRQNALETTLRLLRFKFARERPLPETIVAQVESGTSTDFQRWTERILLAETLAQVFDDSPLD